MNTVFLQDARAPLFLGTSIDLVVTSPPYFNLVDYKVGGQIGIEASFDEYCCNLDAVWDNLIRHLAPGGTVCINVACLLEVSRKNSSGLFDVRSSILRHFFAADFYLHGEIIWDIYNDKYLARQVERFKAVYPPGPLVMNNYEHVLLFRRKAALVGEPKDDDRAPVQAIWQVPWDYDTFPPRIAPELVRRLVTLFSTEGHLVFDPFMGLGTVAEEAYHLGRKFAGTELNPDTHRRCLARLRDAGIPAAAEMDTAEEKCTN